MKPIAYVVAVLAAVGIVIALSQTTPETPESAQVEVAATPVKAMEEPGELTVEVPGMHCQYACFPRVKETLEGTGNVSEVALVEQPDPNTLTVRQIVVKYDAGFELDGALAKLHEEGFKDAAVMQ